MPDTAETFKGDNGEITIEISADGKHVTVTVKPKGKEPPQRIFRPNGRSAVSDDNTEPTGRNVGLWGADDVNLWIYVRDNCQVVCRIMRRKDTEWVEDYSFVLEGLSKEEKKGLLRTIEDRVGWVGKYLTNTATEPLTFAARLTAPGEVFISVGARRIASRVRPLMRCVCSRAVVAHRCQLQAYAA
jgi:hypothetical protein